MSHLPDWIQSTVAIMLLIGALVGIYTTLALRNEVTALRVEVLEEEVRRGRDERSVNLAKTDKVSLEVQLIKAAIINVNDTNTVLIREVKGLSKSIGELNVQMAVQINKEGK